MPPVPRTSLKRRRAQQCRRPHRSPPPIYRHTRATECARLMDASKRRGSWRSHVHRTSTAQRVQSFELQARNVGGRGGRPSPFSGGSKGGILFGKRIPPLPRAAPSALPSPAPSKGENQKGASSSKREYPLCVGDSDKHTDPVRQHGDDAPGDGDAEQDDRHGAL